MRSLLLLLSLIFISSFGYADRIYLFNGPGYNRADPQLVAAITANGHTVVVNNTSTPSLPAGFTCTSIDPVNGYDWLCFFGELNYSSMSAQVKTFIDAGGKVFHQYEVSCCTASASSAASIAASVTGLPITTNFNSYIALGSTPAWRADINCISIYGNAYKGLDNVPLPNQLRATANLNGSSPSISLCENFGFKFTTTDFTGTADQGAYVGLGDVNAWYTGFEPPNNGGTQPVNMDLVRFYFPSGTDTCGIVPPGPVTSCALVVNLGTDTTLCTGQSLLLSQNIAGASYQWQDASSNSTYTVTQPGTYWIKVTSGACTKSDTINVSFTSPPVINLGTDTTLCPGETLQLDATTASASYLWNDGSAGSQLLVSQGGIYSVQVTVNSCVSSDSITVYYYNTPVADIGNDTSLCNGQTLFLDATESGVTYLWQDGSTTSQFIVSSAGTYVITITSGTCSSTDTVDVTFFPSPTVSLGNDTTICQGSSLTLNAYTPGASYSWQDGTVDSARTVTQAGVYHVMLNIGSCYASDTVNVSVSPLPTVNLGNDIALCTGDTLILSVSDPTLTYTWNSGSTNDSLPVTTQGTYWIAADDGRCTGYDTINVTFKPLPFVTLGPDTSICEEASLVLNAFYPGATYQWQDNSSDTTLTVTLSGTYSVEVELNGCFANDTIVVVTRSLPFVDLGNDSTLCSGQALTLNATVTGAAYQWQDNSTTAAYLVNSAGTYWVNVTVNNCTSSDTVKISYNPVPFVNIGSDSTLCAGQSLLLDATTLSASYLWQDNTTGAYHLAESPGKYWVRVTVNNCSASDTVDLSYITFVDRMVSDTTICSGESLLLDATTANATYEWDNNAITSTLLVNSAGTYWVDISIAQCSSRETINVNTDDCSIVLEMPNVFSPDNSGMNDHFVPRKINGISTSEFAVYNRWGQKIFSSSDVAAGWNGKDAGGKECPGGTYYWIVNCIDRENNPIEQKGFVMLIRGE